MHDFFFFYRSGDHRDLHSFPTRRSSDLAKQVGLVPVPPGREPPHSGGAPSIGRAVVTGRRSGGRGGPLAPGPGPGWRPPADRKSTRLNSSHGYISYAVFCLKKKNKKKNT